jgi:hypothetical protein
MPEEHVKAGKVDEAEEVLDVVFPSGDEAAEVVHPGKEPLHFPAFSITAQLAAILSSALASTPVRGNQFDSVVFSELRVERVRVVGFVADEPGREFVEKASGKNFLNKLALGRRSALDRYGERKTVISGDSDDLRALAATGGADGEAPFLALAKVASTNASSRFSRPRSCRCRASIFSASSSFPLRIHCWNRRWQVWYGGYFSGSSRHCAPVPSTQNTPFSTARVSCHGRPRLSSRRCGRSTGSMTAHCSSVSSQRPVTALRGHPRADPGSHENGPQVFMRLVLEKLTSRARGREEEFAAGGTHSTCPVWVCSD